MVYVENELLERDPPKKKHYRNYCRTCSLFAELSPTIYEKSGWMNQYIRIQFNFADFHGVKKIFLENKIQTFENLNLQRLTLSMFQTFRKLLRIVPKNITILIRYPSGSTKLGGIQTTVAIEVKDLKHRS